MLLICFNLSFYVLINIFQFYCMILFIWNKKKGYFDFLIFISVNPNFLQADNAALLADLKIATTANIRLCVVAPTVTLTFPKEIVNLKSGYVQIVGSAYD